MARKIRSLPGSTEHQERDIASTATKSTLPKADPVPEVRSVARLGDKYLYMTLIKQRGGPTGISLLAHATRFTEKQLQEMVTTATSLVDTVRLPHRRQQLVSQTNSPNPKMAQAAIGGAEMVNENWFKSDVEFFDAVMADKYQFLIVLFSSAASEIDPTLPNDVVKQVQMEPEVKNPAA